MSDYTPTTDRVRGAFQDTWGGSERHGRAFDRWLAAHDAEVLNEASNRVRTWLRNPGDRCGLDEIEHVIHDVIQATPYGVEEVAAAREDGSHE